MTTPGESHTDSKRVAIAVFLLSLSAIYAVIVETWSAPILFLDSRGPVFVTVTIAGILAFYAAYGWIIYQVWRRTAWARWVLLFLITLGIAAHVVLALDGRGELFGPVAVTVFLDGLRVTAFVLLLVAPAAYWRTPD